MSFAVGHCCEQSYFEKRASPLRECNLGEAIFMWAPRWQHRRNSWTNSIAILSCFIFLSYIFCEMRPTSCLPRDLTRKSKLCRISPVGRIFSVCLQASKTSLRARVVLLLLGLRFRVPYMFFIQYLVTALLPSSLPILYLEKTEHSFLR